MDETDGPSVGPPLDAVEGAFHVREIRTDGDRILYYGQALVPQRRLMEDLWPTFRDAGYEVELTTADRVKDDRTRRAEVGGTEPTDGGQRYRPDDRTPWAEPAGHRTEHVIVAEPVSVGVDGIPWTNVILFVLTILSTLYAGAAWYHINLAENPLAIWKAWPFTAAVMGVLGVHELGHYVMSRYHGVNATLPYFIPIPSLIGTMGAVIRMKGRMPDREALFDIGVAGPLAGLVATVVVTAIGLTLDPVHVPESVRNSADAIQIQLGYPPLMYILAELTGQPLNYSEPDLAINPVVIGGWVGMFVTFLNMLPVGQLDGGHITRAMFGQRQETLAAIVPAILFGLAGFLYLFQDVAGNAVFIWVFWGLFASVFAFVGPAAPMEDGSLDSRRKAVGVLALVLGALCFTPVPIAISA